MKLCPLCHHRYEDRFISCAHDRTTLVTEPRPLLLKEADVTRRAHPLSLTYAIAISVGLVGGLLIGSWGASVSSPITSQAIPSAKAAGRTEPASSPQTTPDDRVDEPLVADVETPFGGAENPADA